MHKCHSRNLEHLIKSKVYNLKFKCGDNLSVICQQNFTKCQNNIFFNNAYYVFKYNQTFKIIQLTIKYAI